MVAVPWCGDWRREACTARSPRSTVNRPAPASCGPRDCRHRGNDGNDAQIYVAYSKSLETRNPPVAGFLSRITLDPAVVNQWILEIGRDKKDPRDVAEEWVKNNMDTVNQWIN